MARLDHCYPTIQALGRIWRPESSRGLRHGGHGAILECVSVSLRQLERHPARSHCGTSSLQTWSGPPGRPSLWESGYLCHEFCHWENRECSPDAPIDQTPHYALVCVRDRPSQKCAAGAQHSSPPYPHAGRSEYQVSHLAVRSLGLEHPSP